MSQDKFTCPACGKEYEGDTRVMVKECVLCRRAHCQECIDEYNRCAPCAEKTKDR